MNNYFTLSSTSNNDIFSTSGNNNANSASTPVNPQVSSADLNNPNSFAYENEYNRTGFSSNFDRVSFTSPNGTKDPLGNNYSNFTMMQAAAAASISNPNPHHHHHLHQHHQQQVVGSSQQQQQVQPNQVPIHLQQHSSANDYLLATSNGTSPWKQNEPIASSSIGPAPGNDMISSATMPAASHPHHQLSSFSMAVTNPMLYYAHPWMRPGKTKNESFI